MKLSFTSNRGGTADLWLHDVREGSDVRLTTGERTGWGLIEPSGHRAAYVRLEERGRSLRLVDLGTRENEDSAINGGPMGWSSDGKWLLTQMGTSIRAVEIASKRTADILQRPPYRLWQRRSADLHGPLGTTRSYEAARRKATHENVKLELPPRQSRGNSSRIRHTGNRDIGANCLVASAPTASPAITDVAHFSDKSRRRVDLNRFIHRPDSDRPSAVRPGCPVASPSADCSRQRHGGSDGGLDGAADD